MPAFSLIANGARLTPQRIAAIRAALVGADAAQRTAWGENIAHGAEPAADKDYDVVRKLRARGEIPEQGNF
jgi:hypothetical protein